MSLMFSLIEIVDVGGRLVMFCSGFEGRVEFTHASGERDALDLSASLTQFCLGLSSTVLRICGPIIFQG